MGNLKGRECSAKEEMITQQQAYEIALDAYCYFYPLITMDLTRRQFTNMPAGKIPGFGPPNCFTHMRAYPDANFKAVVRPNFDTLYSVAWLDLSREPQIISTPDTGGRYYLLQMLDMWTDVFASPGWRTSSTGAQKLAIVPQGWTGTLPSGAGRIEAPTSYVWIIGRIKTDGPDDYDNVHRVQDALSITALSDWGKAPRAVEAKIDATVDMKTLPLEQINKMSAQTYFATAGELLKLHKPHVTDWSIMARLKIFGFEPGSGFDIDKLEPSCAKEFARGASDGLKLMTAKKNSMGRLINGWSVNADSIGVYGNYYLKRAIVSMIGLGANQPEDAIYPMNFADADGQPPVGEKNYILHFSKEQLPPVHAFWSLTMYDVDGFQVANPINRFAISSWMPLKTNPDGAVDLYIQHTHPGPEKESNWLPAPASGTLSMTMRLYAPADSVLNGDWVPPAIQRVP